MPFIHVLALKFQRNSERVSDDKNGDNGTDIIKTKYIALTHSRATYTNVT